jgi:hypothetical protein
MKNAITILWNWYWRERSGVLLFTRLRGYRRLVLDLPVVFMCVYVLYSYLSSFPSAERNFVFSTFGNPVCVIAILCIAAHQIGIGYLRDQLTPDLNSSSKLALVVPGRVLALYKQERGNDLAVKALRRIRLVAFVSFSIGMLVANWDRISHR